MYDPIASAYASAARGELLAPCFAFAAGAVTALGPCVAPRFLGVAAMAARAPRIAQRLAIVTAVCVGLFAAYSTIGAVANLAMRLGAASAAIYAVLAVALIACGVSVIVRGAHDHVCAANRLARTSLGAAFFLGLSFGFVISPCCTPIVAAIGTFAASSSGTAFATALIAAFVLGHALPLYAVAFGAARLERLFASVVSRQAAATISGALLVFLGAYYAVLA